jgi:Protein of unknown function (DUF5818)
MAGTEVPHPYLSNQALVIVGTLTSEGVECQAMRSDNNDLFTLVGDLGGFASGDRVEVRGKVAEVSFCQQGTTISVSKIAKCQ